MFEITLKFLAAVKENNNKEWLHTHRDLYQQEKKRFEQLVASFLEKTKKLNPDRESLTPKDCIFRFNKDLRFSKEGNPYKENFGAVFAFGGKKSDFPCFYFHLAPRTSFFWGGVYMPFPSSENKIRKLLLTHYHERESLTCKRNFKSYYGDVHAEHFYKSTYKFKQLIAQDPELLKHLSPNLANYGLADYVKSSAMTVFPADTAKVLEQLAYYRDWIFMHPISDEELCGNEVLEKMLEASLKLAPILDFFNKAY